MPRPIRASAQQRLVQRRVHQENREFFPAHPAELVLISQATLRCADERFENGIACVVPVLIVDRFKSIKVDGENG